MHAGKEGADAILELDLKPLFLKLRQVVLMGAEIEGDGHAGLQFVQQPVLGRDIELVEQVDIHLLDEDDGPRWLGYSFQFGQIVLGILGMMKHCQRKCDVEAIVSEREFPALKQAESQSLVFEEIVIQVLVLDHIDPRDMQVRLDLKDLLGSEHIAAAEIQHF